MKIKDIITTQPLWISPDTTLTKAALGMKVSGAGILPICENDRLVGTITDRDITVRGIAEGLDPKTTLVREIMSSDAVWCFEEQDIEEAAGIMEKWHIRRLPVLNQENRLVGIVSLADLAVQPETDSLAVRVLTRISEPAFATT